MSRLSLALAAACLAAPAAAQDTDLELVLLADASGSIDEGEIRFQREGYAEAITDPEVLAAIEGTAYGSIAVTYVEWASHTAQVVGWTRIDGAESAAGFAASLRDEPRRAYGRNAIGSALLDALRLIERNDIDGWRRVIDFSGDSANSYAGPGIAEARDEVVAAGVTINALPILRPEDGRRAGANLEAAMPAFMMGGAKGIEPFVKKFQDTMMRVKYAAVPVVPAVQPVW